MENVTSSNYDPNRRVELTADGRTDAAAAEAELDALDIVVKLHDTIYDTAHTCWYILNEDGWKFQFAMVDAEEA